MPTSSVEPVTFDVALAALRTVLRGKVATYVAVPMTTGRRYVDWWQRVGASLPKGAPEADASWRREVWEPNIADAELRISELRNKLSGPIIDPTRFDPRGEWSQLDYHNFWAQVFREFVIGLVITDGWELSVGCAKEVDLALRLGIPVTTERLEPFDREAALRRMDEGVALLASAGIVNRELETLLSSIKARLDEATR